MVRARPTLLTLGAVSVALLIAWVGAGCSRHQKSRPGTTARIERGILSRYGVKLGQAEASRSLAQGGPRCFNDRFTPDQIRAEITRKELATHVPPLSAKDWDGIDLSPFPPAQASYLLRNSEWIHTQGLDFSSCTDAPCVVDTIYGKPGSIVGWLNYGWFLETGYMLSLERKFPDPDQGFKVVEKQLDLKNYPFSESKLFGFWRLNAALPDIYRFMSDLQTIHQVPAGNYPLAWYPKNPDGTRASVPNICGISYGNYLQGIILFRESCLNMSDPAFDFSDVSYQYIVHEMTHRLDYLVKEDGEKKNDLLSETPQWLALSGWYKQSVTDPATGKSTFSWKKDRPTSSFVRDYAATNPSEDFAETTAWYRMRADQALAKEPEKFAFLRDKIFGGRDYSHEGLLKYYASTITQAADSAVLDVVSTCASASTSSSSAAPSGRLQVDMAVSPALLACVERGLEAKMAAAGDSLRYNEPEACGLLDAQESQLRVKAFQDIAPDVKEALAKQAAVAKLLKASQDLHDALAAQLDPREAYLHCLKAGSGRSPGSVQQSPEECFKNELTGAFGRIGGDFSSSLGDLYPSEKASYLEANDFQKTAAKVASFYLQLFAGIDPTLQRAAASSWDRCVNADVPDTVQPSPAPDVAAEVPVDVLTDPFSGGSHFISAGILNCINPAIHDDLRPLMDQFLDHLGLSISDPDIRHYAEGLLLPTYLTALQTRADHDEGIEDQERESRKNGVLDVLAAGLLSHRDWVNGELTVSGAIDQCEPVAAGIFDSYFTKVSPEQRLPVHFASWADLRSQWSRDACAKVISENKDISASIERTFDTAFSRAIVELDSLVLARAKEAGQRCIRSYPEAKHFWSPAWAKRRSCLKRHWSEVESSAVADWKASLTQKALGDDDAAISDHLSAKRSRLRYSAVRELNSEYK